MISSTTLRDYKNFTMSTTTSLLHSPPPLPTTTRRHFSPPLSPATRTLTHNPVNIRSVRCKSDRSDITPSTPNTLLSTITALLWGKSLPPHLLISTVRSLWSSTWHLMMSQLAPSNPTGSYSRPPSQFGATTLTKTTNLHLYVALPCPWAHRTLIVRALKGLESTIPISILTPGVDGSWEFRVRANGFRNLREVYKSRAGGYDGRATVPMLWDMEKKDVVCNESYDIIQLLTSEFNDLADNPELDLAPPMVKRAIEEWNRIIYPKINNGVYRCGFAQSQEAYEAAVTDLFDALDLIEDHLQSSRYLCGDALTLADICLFTTLIRFDLVYHVMFKCTKKKIIEYPNLHAYMRDIYQIPKVAETCDFEAIMDGYFKFLFPLNPGNIRPVMPYACEHQLLLRPHNRESLSELNQIKVVI